MPKKNAQIPQRVEGVKLSPALQEQVDSLKADASRQLWNIRHAVEKAQKHAFTPQQHSAAQTWIWSTFEEAILGSQAVIWVEESILARSKGNLDEAAKHIATATRVFSIQKGSMIEKRAAVLGMQPIAAQAVDSPGSIELQEYLKKRPC